MRRVLVVFLSVLMVFSFGNALNVSAFAAEECSYSAQKPEKKEKQDKKTKKGKKGKKDASVAPAVENKAEKKGPEALDKFIKKEAQVKDGLVKVIKQDDKYYFAVPDSLLGKEILVVSRLTRAAAGIRGVFSGYAGDQVNQTVVFFEKGPGDKIFIREMDYSEMADEDSGIYDNLKRSSLQAIIGSFDIKAQSAGKDTSVIDVTDFFNSDNPRLYFGQWDKSAFSLVNMEKDKSYVASMRTYPINTEVTVVKTFSRKNGLSPATFEFNVSMVELPEDPMTPRYFDPRVGYFTANYTSFDKNPQGVETVRMITRWRLEPKPEDMEKYMAGELVEPAKPIVYYIDPTTPEEWVPYLIQGVNDWAKVFEKAGFKNAIYARMAPTAEEDSTWSLEDARYSAIVYKPSDIPNASGPHVHDPRTGEILESHINWYHNVMKLIHHWYFVQCGPLDTGAQKMTYDKELMGQLIRFVSSHEVGHTLGLRHNFIGSASYTPEQLRDADFLRENGSSTTLMDYSRFNYVAQPEDNIPRELLFPRLSHYDDWAIEWGYRRYYQFDTPEEELSYLNEITTEKLKNPYYRFGTETSANDPRYQSEDFTNNQMVANALGIKNLKIVMENLEDWTATPNTGYEDLREMQGEVLNQYLRYVGHVAKWVGGRYETPKYRNQEGALYEPVEKDKQKEAMQWLDEYVFNAPKWLVPEDIVEKTGVNPMSQIERVYSRAFSAVVSRRVLSNMYRDEVYNGSSAYTMKEYFSDLYKYIFTGAKVSDPYVRLLQKSYVKALCDLYTGESDTYGKLFGIATPDNTDVISTVVYQLEYLKGRMASLGNSYSDPVVKGHFQYMEDALGKALEDGFNSAIDEKGSGVIISF